MTTRKMFVLLVVVAVFFISTGVAEAHGRHNRSSKSAVITAGAIIGAVGLFGLLRSSQAADVDRTAITEEQRTRREQIRASTVLAVPAALGPAGGSAGYSSSEGYANIQANLGSSPTAPSSRLERERLPPPQPRSSHGRGSRLPKVDVRGFESAGKLLADRMTPEEFRAYGYALREVEDDRPAHSRQTHREFVVPTLYELLFKLKSVGSPQQIAAWWSVIRYLEKAGGV